MTLHVITGGPGAGKSALIAALAAQGMDVAFESGRQVIRDQIAAQGDALPWRDAEAFAQAMTALDCQAYRNAAGSVAPVLFDRGLPDVIGYRRLAGLPEDPALQDACHEFRYDDPVFLAPWWPEIFTQDAERRQDSVEAERTSAMMREVYTMLGYRLVELPLAPVPDRVAFILHAIGLDPLKGSALSIPS